jgi:hypothetical protein
LRKKYVLIGLTALTLVSLLVVGMRPAIIASEIHTLMGISMPDNATPPGSFSGLQVHVGPEESVGGPITNYLDYSFFTMLTSTGLTAYSSNVKTFGFPGESLDSLRLPAPAAPASQVVLSPGPQGNFDECGAWLASAYEVTPTHWIGWYHAEHTCDYSANVTHKSMAFAESFDGGKTWQKPGYPANQVVTPDAQYAGDPVLDRAGDAKVIRQGNYFYMMYVGGDYKTYVARSLVTDEGKPGTWYKYYQGSYSQPGIGGHQTPVDAQPGSLTFNTYLNAYLTISVSAKYGFYLKASVGTDITRWMYLMNNESIYPLVSTPQDPRQDVWVGRTSAAGQVYGYPAFIAPDGDSSETGKSFYVYYMKLFNGDTFAQRYLMRRLITLNVQQDPVFPARVDLVRYHNPATQKIRVSTDLARPSEGYTFTNVIGSLLTYPAPGFHPIYECYIPIYNDYLPTISDPAQYQWQSCEGSGTDLIRNIGWASDVALPDASLAIYRCFNNVLLNHFISTDPACEGSTVEGRLGYIFP